MAGEGPLNSTDAGATAGQQAHPLPDTATSAATASAFPATDAVADTVHPPAVAVTLPADASDIAEGSLAPAIMDADCQQQRQQAAPTGHAVHVGAVCGAALDHSVGGSSSAAFTTAALKPECGQPGAAGPPSGQASLGEIASPRGVVGTPIGARLPGARFAFHPLPARARERPHRASGASSGTSPMESGRRAFMRAANSGFWATMLRWGDRSLSFSAMWRRF